jgi:hypothetical protein
MRKGKGDVISENFEVARDVDIERVRLCAITEDFTSIATFIPLRNKQDVSAGGKVVANEDYSIGTAIFYVEKGGDEVKHVMHDNQSSWLKFNKKVYYMNAPMCEVSTMPSSRMLFEAVKPQEVAPRVYSEDFGEYLNAKVVLNEVGLSEYLCLWTLGTFLFDAFFSYPYGWVHGVWKSGKSTLIETCAYGSFYGKFVTDLTPANIYRLVDATGSALCIDEGEDLFKTYGNGKRSDDAQRVVSLLNSGYKDGAVVPRADSETGIVVDYRTYSPKMFASVNQIDQTLSSRCTMVITTRLPDADRPIKAHVADLAAFRNSMYIYRLFYGSKIKTDYRTFLTGGATDKYHLKQRVGELFLPIVFLCLKFRPDWFDNLMIFIEKQKKIKSTQTASSLDAVIMGILKDFVMEEKASSKPDYWLGIAEIQDSLKKTEYNTIPDKSVGNVLSRLGFSESKKVNGRVRRCIDPKRIVEL